MVESSILCYDPLRSSIIQLRTIFFFIFFSDIFFFLYNSLSFFKKKEERVGGHYWQKNAAHWHRGGEGEPRATNGQAQKKLFYFCSVTLLPAVQ